jgi:methionyl-tRNA formyltransferase
MNYLVVTTKQWNLEVYEEHISKLEGSWLVITDKENLTLDNIQKISPKYIFFIHWSWIVPEEIVKRHECVCFHMTDLPYGRGGSPLQNLIVQGCEKTMLSALRMEKGVDTGPIYYKKPLSLHGSAYDIYKRAGKLCWDMISDFIKDNPCPVSQKGVVTNFKRRTPEQSQIPEGLLLKEMYDYIRMLDAPGYPKAFLEMNGYRLEFESSDYTNHKLNAKVSFIKREDNV